MSSNSSTAFRMRFMMPTIAASGRGPESGKKGAVHRAQRRHLASAHSKPAKSVPNLLKVRERHDICRHYRGLGWFSPPLARRRSGTPGQLIGHPENRSVRRYTARNFRQSGPDGHRSASRGVLTDILQHHVRFTPESRHWWHCKASDSKSGHPRSALPPKADIRTTVEKGLLMTQSGHRTS